MADTVHVTEDDAMNGAVNATTDFGQSLRRVLDWARGERYYGYSKFDAFNSPVMRALVPDVSRLRAVAAALWARSPVDLRPLMRTEKLRNPKGIALFALAYLRRYKVLGDESDLDEARHLLDWLDETAVQGFSGPCWGYDHDWYGLHFTAPKHSPNIIVTGNVAYAFLEAFEVTADARYLDVARGVVRFLLEDLGASVDTAEMRNIGYVPGNVWGVLNINGIAASILSRVAKHTGEAELLDHARRLIAFLVDKQTDYGAWHYAWPASTSNVAHDNYHTANVLDWLLDYRRYTGDEQFHGAALRGLEFFRDHLFEPDGLPKWRSHRAYPADAHGAGQALVTFAKAALEVDPSYLEDGRRVGQWTLANLQSPQGFFYYQKGRFWLKRYTLMRWCNGWMAYGLSSWLLAASDLRLPPSADSDHRPVGAGGGKPRPYGCCSETILPSRGLASKPASHTRERLVFEGTPKAFFNPAWGCEATPGGITQGRQSQPRAGLSYPFGVKRGKFQPSLGPRSYPGAGSGADRRPGTET